EQLAIFVDEGGKFKIDDAETTVLLAIGDIAGESILVANTVVFFEGGEKFLRLAITDGDGPLPAIARDDAESCGVRLEKTRDIFAAESLEMPQDRDFGFEALLRIEPAEGFFDASVESDINP